MTTTLNKIMEEGWEEFLELGFIKPCDVLYIRGDERLVYDPIKDKIKMQYRFNENK